MENKQKIGEEWSDLLFGVRRSIRYNMRRRQLHLGNGRRAAIQNDIISSLLNYRVFATCCSCGALP
jgi:hypothetical protein